MTEIETKSFEEVSRDCGFDVEERHLEVLGPILSIQRFQPQPSALS